MGVISIILLVLFVIVCLLLIFVVAIQSEDSEGLGGIFGGSSESTFGSNVSSVITKFTAILGGTFLVLALVVALVNKTPSSDSLLQSVTSEQVQQVEDWWSVSTSDVQ